MPGRIWNFVFNFVMNVSGKTRVPVGYEVVDDFLKSIVESDVSEVQNHLIRGSDPNTRDQHGRTALMLAVENACLPIVKLLLESGAHINAVGYNGYTALHIAVGSSLDQVVQSNGELGQEDIEIVVCLLEAGSDIQVTDNDQDTPMSIAQKHRSAKIINLLESYA